MSFHKTGRLGYCKGSLSRFLRQQVAVLFVFAIDVSRRDGYHEDAGLEALWLQCLMPCPRNLGSRVVAYVLCPVQVSLIYGWVDFLCTPPKDTGIACDARYPFMNVAVPL